MMQISVADDRGQSCLRSAHNKDAKSTAQRRSRSTLCCVKQLSLSPERSLLIYPSLSDPCYFFPQPSGFVSVTCLSLSPLKMIDRGRKSPAQLLSQTYPEQDHPSSKDFFVSADDVKSTFFSVSSASFSYPTNHPAAPLPSALYAIIITLKMKIVISHIFHLNKNPYLCTLFTLYLLSSFFFISLAYVNAGYLADHFYSQVSRPPPPLPLMHKAVSDMFPPWTRFYKANTKKWRKKTRSFVWLLLLSCNVL